MKGGFGMKHNKLFTTILTVALSMATAAPAYAATIPRETAPINATEEQIQIVENLIGGYLDEINAGAGYGMIASEADNLQGGFSRPNQRQRLRNSFSNQSERVKNLPRYVYEA